MSAGMTATLNPPSNIGRALDRKDGRVKVTGAADYTADVHVPNMAYGVFATSAIAAGRLRLLDTTLAERAPGVVAVMTHRNAPRTGAVSAPAAMLHLPLQDEQISYEGQPIALVVADTLERATYAAGLVSAEYDLEAGTFDLQTDWSSRERIENGYDEPDTRTGDPDAALHAAEIRFCARYETTYRHHNAMEPSATTAVWDGDRLTLYDATQHVWGVQSVVAAALQVPAANVRVISHYLGGGFGSKGYVWPHQILVPMAARFAGRPVKLVLTRAQMYAACGYQTATIQDVAIGMERDGTLRAITHDVVYANAQREEFPEYAAVNTRVLYACPNIATTHRVLKVNLIQPTAMRAPNEGMGSFGLESALDELAWQTGIDPLELRLRNYAEHDPLTGRPFSSKKLREAYALGAEKFGWSRAARYVGERRDGDQLIGHGMATCLMSTYRMPSTARLRMRPDGSVVVEAGSQEIGTGVRTIMPQIAADVLGVDPAAVTMVLGDTDLPVAGPTYGSSSTMGLGSAVADAALKLKARLAELGRDGESYGESYTETMARVGADIVAEGAWEPAENGYAMFTFGAVFVEVRVDRALGLVHAKRCVGAYSVGRVINRKTATSQMTGGMIWGLGQALLERSDVDARLGRFVSKNLSGYLVPVNADVGMLEAHFVDEYDDHASAIGAKGIGELGATGVAAAVANAVYHATGKRLRSLPIRPEMLIDA